MNYRELIEKLTPQVGRGEAWAIVRMVMEQRFGLSQTDLLLGKDTTLSADDRKEFQKIANRLLKGEPVQYVLGFADFCEHRFRVTPDVLIPRPETEELVQWVIQSYGDSAPRGIVDFCTGSGCIATSLALAFPEAEVVGVDISDAALDVARENARQLQARNVTFFRKDVLDVNAWNPSAEEAVVSETSFVSEEAVVHGKSVVSDEAVSVFVSNPPYVRDSEAVEMSATVLDYEPHLALFVPDSDPLRFYRAITALARHHLLPGGYLFLEINAAFGEEVLQLLCDAGFSDVQLRKDQYERPRMVRATKIH